jgi:hypothetical protein
MMKRRLKPAALVLVSCLGASALSADSVAVRYAEGVVRGFLVLRAPDGSVIANGDSIQFARSGRVTNRLVFHFRDGSLQDETAVFTQRKRFQLVSDHLIQRGPSFPHPMEMSIDAASGRVTVRHRDGDKEQVVEERMELPPDLANGIVSTLVKNLAPDAASLTVPMVVASPKPRLVKLLITRAGLERFSAGRNAYKATRFNVKVEIGGIAGVVAPLVGKEPKEASVWIVRGEAPGFIASESQFFQDAPLWRIELAAPNFPKN